MEDGMEKNVQNMLKQLQRVKKLIPTEIYTFEIKPIQMENLELKISNWSILDKYRHIHWMIETCEKELQKENFDLLKANRWFGFIQGFLVFLDITTIENERNETRNKL